MIDDLLGGSWYEVDLMIQSHRIQLSSGEGGGLESESPNCYSFTLFVGLSM